MKRLLLVLACLTIAMSASGQANLPTGELVEGLKCQADESQTYTLYLPSYLTTDRKWPVLLIYDPRGRATMAAEIFRPAAEKYGWILVSSNDTRSDGPPDPNIKALNALLPEVGRYPIDENRLYMTGFSGGAILAFVVAARGNGAVAGVIGCGGRFPDGWEKAPVKFSHWGTAGNTDFNFSQMKAIDEFLEETGANHRFESFEGTHQWMPQDFAEDAVAWMELDAMRRGLREKDAETIERLWNEDIERAAAAERGGDPADVLRAWKSIEGTFDGLRDVTQASARVRELGGSKDVRAALRNQRKWDRWEEQMRRQMGVAVATLRREERPVPIGRLTGELRLDEINKHAAGSGYESLAAGRVLSSMYAQMSFYLYREFMSARNYDRAALVLQVAEILRPGSSFVLYNLACAMSRLGAKDDALEALEKAIDAGFSNAQLMKTDEDLATLRDEPAFGELLARIEK